MSTEILSKRELAAKQKNDAALYDLKVSGGIIAKGAWQTGTGNYKKARDIPAGAQVYHRDAAVIPPAKISRWFIDHPRAQACVALVD